MSGLQELTTTLARLHEVQRESWTREADAERELIARLERELTEATDEARAQRERTRAEVRDARAHLLAVLRRRSG